MSVIQYHSEITAQVTQQDKVMTQSNHRLNESPKRELFDSSAAKTDLKQALAYEQLVLYYQPQIKLETGEVSGIEAFVRWNHPQFGLLSPDKFIPLAEENNLMDALGQWVLTTACRQNKLWQDQGLSSLTMSANLSPSQVQNPNLRDLVSQALKTTRLAPRWLELEITEDAIFSDPEMTHQVLLNLKQLGVHLCLDDFGNGYSSVYYLSTLPFGTLKIAQSCLNLSSTEIF